ncbi:hypothetical protein E4U45_004332 [Claviceps purpurea]|nr:hypothetical protein E4U45_004332 [Claviceps purpurea]
MPKPHPSSSNPIQTALSKWISTINPPDDTDNGAFTHWQQTLLDNAPKRFTVYEPMALLPAGSFSNLPWTTELLRHSTPIIHALWTLLLQELSKNGKSKQPLTHLAVNEGIPLLQSVPGATTPLQAGENNVMRRPSSLRILHGDFGPSEPHSPPSESDFAEAFWVSTKQNGIVQTWAPRWTMFSRGNVKEKARLLEFPAVSRRPPPPTPTSSSSSSSGAAAAAAAAGADTSAAAAEDTSVWAVDLYAGIGYFAFCYAKLGMRVLCWELNPWSIEALRRGAELNKWSVDVFHEPTARGVSTEEITRSQARIVVMAEDNGLARARIEDMRREGGMGRGWLRDVRHVNCGLLPSSRLTWNCALFVTRSANPIQQQQQQQQQQSWLHLHENVGESDIESRKGEIETLLVNNPEEKGLGRRIRVEGVEKVKTYAPGVWHCVFDVVVGE